MIQNTYNLNRDNRPPGCNAITAIIVGVLLLIIVLLSSCSTVRKTRITDTTKTSVEVSENKTSSIDSSGTLTKTDSTGAKATSSTTEEQTRSFDRVDVDSGILVIIPTNFDHNSEDYLPTTIKTTGKTSILVPRLQTRRTSTVSVDTAHVSSTTETRSVNASESHQTNSKVTAETTHTERTTNRSGWPWWKKVILVIGLAACAFLATYFGLWGTIWGWILSVFRWIGGIWMWLLAFIKRKKQKK